MVTYENRRPGACPRVWRVYQRWAGWLLVHALGPIAAAAQVTAPPAAQNPSPMVERSRRHERLRRDSLAGDRHTISGPLDRPVAVFVPPRVRAASTVDLLVHFHGEAWLPQQAAASMGRGTVVAVVSLGAGSGVYHRAFEDRGVFDSLLHRVGALLPAGRSQQFARVVLSGFSAGHGAIRQILRDSTHVRRVDAVLLLDGFHTSYVPDGKVMAEGGTLDTANLSSIASFAQGAMRGEKRLLMTHSEIFPGTFASTTETANWLLDGVGVMRRPVLRWGPRGMQQTSEASQGRLTVLGFAGNSAPDHVDHYHAMPELLKQLLRR